MINLALTMLPIALTFTIATWNASTNEIQPRSALPGSAAETCATPCRC